MYLLMETKALRRRVLGALAACATFVAAWTSVFDTGFISTVTSWWATYSPAVALVVMGMMTSLPLVAAVIVFFLIAVPFDPAKA